MSAVFVKFDGRSPPPARAALLRSARFAAMEFLQGILAWRLWLELGLRDIRIRYKRTCLGPLWITVSMVGTFTVMGMLFSAVYKNDITLFLPYLAAGMVIWTFMGAVANEGSEMFVSAHHVIHSLRIPLVVHVLRAVVRHGFIFLHNFAAAMAAHLILGGSLGGDSLWLVLSLPLLFVLLSSGGLILAIIGARFRDLGPAIGMVVQLLFFMTPIMWSPADLPLGRKWWIFANPFYHLIEIIRSPMLGHAPTVLSWGVSVAITAVVALAAFCLFCLFRRRITYWL